MSSSAADASHAPPSFLGPPLLWLTRLALRFPYVTLILALAAAGASIFLTCTRLEFRTSRLDLLDPDSDYNRLWIDYLNEFGDEDDAVVVVEGTGREHVIPVLQEVADGLAADNEHYHAVLHGVDLRRIRSKGLHYLSPDELAGIESFLDQAAPVLQGNWSALRVGHMLAGVQSQFDARQASAVDESSGTQQQFAQLTASLQTSLESKDGYRSPWPDPPQAFATLSELSSEYLLTGDGRMGFVLLRLAKGEVGFSRGSEATDALRTLIAQINERHPRIKIGLTGLPVLENDEMRSSQSSMYKASLLSLAGVAILFVAGFGGIRHALLANIVLLIGIAWSFGYLTLVVGHLNILSMSFTVTLIGIGIDYGVYYVARYLQLRQTIHDPRQALLATSSAVGPAILTGALTTAVSFFAAGCTSFTGIAELGIIAGGGILLCALAELIVLPAVLSITDKGGSSDRLPEPLPVDRWIARLLKRPRLLLASSLAFTVAATAGVEHLWYDHNLLNLQAADLESVQLERKLLAESDQSVWYALSVADDEQELLRRKAALVKLPSVERVEEIVSLLPADQDRKQPVIQRISERLASLPVEPPLIPVDRPEVLCQTLAETGRLLASAGDARGAMGLDRVRTSLEGLPPPACYKALSGFQQQMAGDLLVRLRMLKRMSNPKPPRLDDLPPSLVDRFVGKQGKHLLRVYGRGDLWDMAALSRFVADVRSVDPRATGNPLQAYEASLEMKGSYERAALYALVVILAVLLFELRSWRHVLLAGLPLAVGVMQMFGLMGALGIPLNPANMIALPLILGIGVDYGVHIIHEFRERGGAYRMSQATAVAVLVDGLTTIVGFGSLMIASHQGLQSLGRVLTIGVSCCLFTSLIMLPALLTFSRRGAADATSG